MTVNSKLTGSDGANYLAATGGTVESGYPQTTTATVAAGTANSFSVTTDASTGEKTMTSTTVSGTTATTVVTKYTPNGTGDGSNAVLISALFNSTKANTVNTAGTRSIGDISLNSYYNESMTARRAAKAASAVMSVKMIDKATQEVIKECPPEDMIKGMIKAKEWIGAFLDKNA